MGSPVSVTVTNIAINNVEEPALVSHEIQLPFWKRCMLMIAVLLSQSRGSDKYYNISIGRQYSVPCGTRVWMLTVGVFLV